MQQEKSTGAAKNPKKYWGGLLTTKVTSVRRPAYQGNETFHEMHTPSLNRIT